MASISVVTVTSAWLLAELSTSPLINSLLIGAQNLPALHPLARTIKGVRVFIGATFLLELIVVCLYFQLLPNWVLIVSTLMVVLLASCGSITSLLPMTGIVLEGNTITNQSIQQGADVGSMSGTLISGVVYPYLKLFPPSILLVLAPAWLSKNNFRKIRSMSVVDVPIPVKVPPTEYLSIKKTNIYPLSGISKSKTIYHNENGYYMIYLSDRFGFNNQDKEWDANKIQYLII